MGPIATVSVLTIFGVSMLSAGTSHSHLEAAEVVDMQQTIFNSGGLLEITDSIGDMDIAGWDQPEIEIVITKSTQRRYAVGELDRVLAALDRIVVSTEQRTADHLLVKTAFPSRIAMHAMSGRSNVHLRYSIHVPRNTRLVVRHEMGELKVRDVTANMLLSNRKGDIVLSLPENERYAIDARARTGGVHSELCPLKTFADDGAAPHQLQLRVDVGAITVRKSSVAVDTLVDD